MQRLPMSFKLLALAAVLLLPLSLAAVWIVHNLWNERAGVQRQLSGLQVQQQLVDVAASLLEHQGQMHGLLAGRADAAPALEAARTQLRAASAALDGGIAATGQPELSAKWQPLRDELRLLLNTAPASHSAADWYARQSGLLVRLQRLALLNGETSTLLLDPDRTLFYLVDALVQRQLPLLQASAHLRNEGAVLLLQAQGDGISPELTTQALRLGSYTDVVDEQLRQMQERIEALVRIGATAPAAWPHALASSQQYAAAVRDGIGAGVLATEAQAHFQQGSQVLTRQLELNQQLGAQAQQLLASNTAACNGSCSASAWAPCWCCWRWSMAWSRSTTPRWMGCASSAAYSKTPPKAT